MVGSLSGQVISVSGYFHSNMGRWSRCRGAGGSAGEGRYGYLHSLLLALSPSAPTPLICTSPTDASFGRGQLLTRSQLDNCRTSEKGSGQVDASSVGFSTPYIADAYKAASEEKQSEM